MGNKSSFKRIAWSLAYVTLAVVGLRMLTVVQFAQLPSQTNRLIALRPWRVEPVRVVAAKNKKQPNIEIGNSFQDDDDWLDGFTVTVINNSDKTVTAVSVDMIFRREAGDTRPPVAELLHFGPSPMRPEYVKRDPRQVINVGQRADLQLSSGNYRTLVDILEQKGYAHRTSQIELVIREVGFEDGSVLYSGTLWLPDPNNPHDPTKKIRADKLRPNGAQNHHASSAKGRKTTNPKLEDSPTK